MSTAQPSAGSQSGTAPPASDQGTGELVRQAAQQVSELTRAELRLALAELRDKGRRTGTGAGLFGASGLVALYGVGALLAAVVAALSLAMPVWAAALAVAAVLFAAAAALAAAGRGRTSRAMPPVPERAVENTRKDIAEIKERAHR